MFERYTEKARRVIFFARYEASVHGSKYIETPHLLLGILRENGELFARLLPLPGPPSRLPAKVEALLPAGEPLSTSVDLPLSHESKQALACGAEESERLGHKEINTGHLLLGLLRAGGPEVACLKAHGIEPEKVREEVARSPAEPTRGERQPSDALRQFLLALAQLPPDRLHAGFTLLKALASGKFEVSGTGPDGPFHFSFGGETE
jgi:ATP-dependent Clp protease ATP-binding subunit ClpC